VERAAFEVKRTITILLGDDHPVVRTGFRFCFARHPHLRVVGEASDGEEVLQKARELLPDIILMDVEMPVMSGFAAAEALRKQLPGIKVLFLSENFTPELFLGVVQTGASGYLLKEAPVIELVKAIEAIADGEDFFSLEKIPFSPQPEDAKPDHAAALFKVKNHPSE
jgi:DNA-binding NarL/FixJ family response regulator